MTRRRRNTILIIAAIITLIAALISEHTFYSELSNKKISRQAQRYISDQTRGIEDLLTEISSTIEADSDLWQMNIPKPYLVYITSSKKTVFWNANRITPEHIPFSKNLICHKIDNAWFLYKSKIVKNLRVDILVNVKNNYQISNEYFKNGDYQSELSQYSFSEIPQVGYAPLYDENNQILIYFAKTELNQHNLRHSVLASIAYLLLFFFLSLLSSGWHRDAFINLLSNIGFSVICILLIRYTDIIPIFQKMELFSRDVYYHEGIFDTLGIMFIGGINWIILCSAIERRIKKYEPNRTQAIGITLLLIVLFQLFMIRYVNIIETTDINLELFKVRKLTSLTFWVYSIVLLFLGGWVRLAISLIKCFNSQKGAYLYPLICSAFCIPMIIGFPEPFLSSSLMITLTILYMRRTKVSHYMIIHLITVSLLLSFSTTVITEKETIKRSTKNKKTLIQTLPTTLLFERDYRVEEQLVDIWNEMQYDEILQNTTLMQYNTPEYYIKYFKQKYYRSYLSKYDQQVIICTPESYLHIGGINASPNCYKYFTDMLMNEGERIGKTGFFWQMNNNGRVSYFGCLKLAEGTRMETSIFIDLESPILSEGKGYPELLRDRSKNSSNKPQDLAFARYVDGRLITSSGDFRYHNTDNWVPNSKENIFTVIFDKYEHTCYNVTENSMVVLSEIKPPILYPIYAFIYTFLLFCTCFIFVFLATTKHAIKLKKTMSNDIRLTIFGVLLLSLFLVGTASIFFPLSIYTRNQDSRIADKSESVMAAISKEVAYISNLKEIPEPVLQNFLLSLSNTLYVDINVYNTDGRLYSTSRAQLFNYNLQGQLICARTFNAFSNHNVMSKVHNQTIGNNEYKSNYFVVSNANEEIIAYVNIPFFTSHLDLKNSIWDYLVVLLNIYLLLMIVVFILTYISVNTITKPLAIIEDGLGKMKLGHNEKIEYERDDEIGNLVNKYNLMVDELSVSVDRLAKNEREGAWQRMARQIAHEIKNPLTPMKLSIQHLVYTKSGAPERFNDYFDKTAKTLVEQIDNLSNIASSFSSFAKISDSVPEHLLLNERVQNTVNLFQQSGCEINFTPADPEVEIFMDRDHFIQVFNNLIKNALQAMPEEHDGKIDIVIECSNLAAFVHITDNGMGIDEETQEKIFQPNFTTKNSGMGLGLAISQKMATNAGGGISFTSELGKGTTFTVELPITKNQH